MDRRGQDRGDFETSYPSSELVIDPVLLRKYDVSGPRYVTYPTADRFAAAFGEATYRHALAGRNIGGITRALSLDVHGPVCSDGCCHCGGDEGIARDGGNPLQYLEYLGREISLAAAAIGGDRRIVHMHWGGGVPAFLGQEEMRALCDKLDAHFERAPDCERSIEIDPGSIKPGAMAFLGGLGFNRVSFDVRDSELSNSEAMKGIQAGDLTRGVVDEARGAGFRSVNLNLFYGLPRQTLDSFNRTLDQMLELDPDQITLHGYAHKPEEREAATGIGNSGLVSAESRLQILTLAVGRLTRAGYLYLGMDHFAKPHNDLAIAQRQGRLLRNVHGYSSRPECDVLGFGLGAIGRIGPTYSQNVKCLREYTSAVDMGRLPVHAGLVLSRDDLVRGAVIQVLACNFRLSVESVETAYLINFWDYFSRELGDLKSLEEDGLLDLQPEWIVVTPKGRLLVRTVCMAFDRYLQMDRRMAGYSRVL